MQRCRLAAAVVVALTLTFRYTGATESGEAASQPSQDWVARKAVNLTLSLPQDWEPALFTPIDEGRWTIGELGSPESLVEVLRGKSLDEVRGEAAVVDRRKIVVGPVSAEIVEVEGNQLGKPTRGLLVSPKSAQDGQRPVVLVCLATADRWAACEPVFRKVIASMQIEGAAAADSGAPPASEGQQRWYLSGDGRYQLRIPDDWRLLEQCRGDEPKKDVDTLFDSEGLYSIHCSKQGAAAADAEALNRWSAETIARYQTASPRLKRIVLGGQPAVRISHPVEELPMITSRTAVVHAGVLYRINVVWPRGPTWDELPQPVTEVLESLRFLDKPRAKMAVDQWENHTCGDARVDIPAGWHAASAPPGEGHWINSREVPQMVILLARTARYEDLVAMVRPLRTSAEQTLAGHRAIAYQGGAPRLSPYASGTLLAVNEPGADGRFFGLIFLAEEGFLAEAAPIFQRVKASLKLARAASDTQPPPLAPKPTTRIAHFARPKGLDGNPGYSVTAYQNAIVVRHNHSGAEETVWTGRPGHTVRYRFKEIYVGGTGPQILGSALSDHMFLMNGTVSIQVFEGGFIASQGDFNTIGRTFHVRRAQTTTQEGP